MCRAGYHPLGLLSQSPFFQTHPRAGRVSRGCHSHSLLFSPFFLISERERPSAEILSPPCCHSYLTCGRVRLQAEILKPLSPPFFLLSERVKSGSGTFPSPPIHPSLACGRVRLLTALSWHNKTHLVLIGTLVRQLLAFAPTTEDAKRRLSQLSCSS